jgi:glycosyltransferase involved in cell wall biosynthesis
MRVLVFTSQFCYGGAERLGAELAVDLNVGGVRADVMGMYSESLESAAIDRKVLLDRGVPHVWFLNLQPHPTVWSVVRAIGGLAHVLQVNRYDVVETSSLTPGIIACWACRIAGVRHVHGIHHVFTAADHSGLTHRAFLNAARFISDTRYYAVSDYARAAWIKYAHVRPQTIRTVRNSICLSANGTSDLRGRVRAALGISRTARLILCVGRITAYKRQDLVVEALSQCCKPNNCVLAFLGDIDASVAGTEQMVTKIGEQVAKDGLDSHVRFLGRRDDVHDIMRAADVLVHATTTEAFGLVLAEALALGLPVVSTNVGGIPEVLAGTESVMVPPNDTVALREAVTRVLRRSPEEVAQARERGQRRADAFSQLARTKDMISLFRDVLARRI